MKVKYNKNNYTNIIINEIYNVIIRVSSYITFVPSLGRIENLWFWWLQILLSSWFRVFSSFFIYLLFKRLNWPMAIVQLHEGKGYICWNNLQYQRKWKRIPVRFCSVFLLPSAIFWRKHFEEEHKISVHQIRIPQVCNSETFVQVENITVVEIV